MIESLLACDQNLLLQLNGSNYPLLDEFMWLFTSITVWVPLYLSLLYIWWKKGWKNGLLIFFFAILTIIICDQLASGLLKPLVARLRPTHDPFLEGLVKVVHDYRGGLYGFASSHAANSFGIAVFAALICKQKPFTICFLLWAVMTSYTRLYLGVHYPLDILAGTIIGICGAFLSYWLYTLLGKYMVKKNKITATIPFTSKEMLPFYLTLMATILFILCYAIFVIS